MYLRNKLKLTYHYILSYIYNIFIVRHNKWRIYFKKIYKTDLHNCLKRNAKGTYLYTVDGLIIIPNNIFVGKWMGLYLGGLKMGGGGGGFKSGILQYSGLNVVS